MDIKSFKMRQLMKDKGINLVYKQDSWLMRFISKVLFFNKDFMDNYITTIGSTIYVPNKDLYMANSVIAHEVVHKCDYDRYGYLNVGFMYMSPQWFGIATIFLLPVTILLSIFHSQIWLYSLLGLTFLFPLPSPGRRWVEMRGYAATIAVMYWDGRFNDLDDLDWIIKKFTGPDYYWMWPFKSHIKKELEEWLMKISTNQILYEIPVLKEVKMILLPDSFKL